MLKHIQAAEYSEPGISLGHAMNAFQAQARVLQVLAHPTRLRLLSALEDGEQCVCHLTTLLRRRQAYVSQQLMFLRRAGLLEDRKEGARVYYRIKDPSLLPVLKALNVTGARQKAGSRKTVAGCPCPQCAQAGKTTPLRKQG